MNKPTVGQNIRRFRKEKTLTQSELAELLGVSVQAVSKWETDVGMPDISQIVPLARVLDVTTDRLLGMEDTEQDAAFDELKKRIGRSDRYAFDFSRDGVDTHYVYETAVSYFDQHPTSPKIAYICLRSLAQLVKESPDMREKSLLLAEGERYANCIFRYDTVPDHLFRTYYVLSRFYKSLGEAAKAEEYTGQIPEIFGDRTYFEAEVAMADGDYETALQKCRESFSTKARFMARLIRMAAQIHCAWDGGRNERTVVYNEYMLNMLNAFLSCSDFVPMRQVFQKDSLLYGIVTEYLSLDRCDDAFNAMEELFALRDKCVKFLALPQDTSCLMLIDMPCDDGRDGYCIQHIDKFIQRCLDAMDASPLTAHDLRLQEMKERFAMLQV